MITVNLVSPERETKVRKTSKPEPKIHEQKSAQNQMKYKAKQRKAQAKPKPKATVKPKAEKARQTQARSSTRAARKASTSGVRVDEDFRFGYYLEIIKEKISETWTPPPVRTASSLTTIYFRINRNGKISDVKIEQSSGSDIFDRSALRAVSEAAPLPPLPAGFKGRWLGVHFEFEHRSG